MNRLDSIQVVSKELCISKDRIKKMIKNNEISYENRSGQFFVNVEEVRESLNNETSCYHSTFLKMRMDVLLERCLSFYEETSSDEYILNTLKSKYNLLEINELTWWLLSMETEEIRKYYNENYCNNQHLDIEPLSDMIDIFVHMNENFKDELSVKYYLNKTLYNYSYYLHKNGKRKSQNLKEHSKKLLELIFN